MASRATTILLTALITAVVTSGLWFVGILAYRFAGGEFGSSILNDGVFEQPDFVVDVQVPDEARVGETLTMTVRVSNPTDVDLELGSIDIYETFLDGFRVVSKHPRPTDESSLFDFHTWYFEETLSPGETFEYRLELVAEEAGAWTGDVDACTPEEAYVTHSVTVMVREAGVTESAGGAEVAPSAPLGTSKPPPASVEP